MLKSLTIKNLAIIDDISVNFNDGFSVIIGETGAGKSIIIEAINFILGARANNSMIKQDCEKSFLTGRFSINEEVKQYLNNSDIDYDDEIEIVRILNVNGKSSYKINGNSVNLSTINKIRELLIEIKRQSDNEISNDEYFAINFIDKYGKISETNEYKSYSVLYKEWLEVKEKLKNLEDNALNIDVDYVKMQINRIDEIATYENELEELIEKSKMFSNSFKLTEISNDIHKSSEELYEISSKINLLYNEFIALGGNKTSEYSEINVLIEDFVNSFSYDEVSLSESEMEYIEDRIYNINKIFKLYGGSYEEMIKSYDLLNEQLYQYENAEDLVIKYNDEIKRIELELTNICSDLNAIRKSFADKICDNASLILDKLYMEDSAILFEFVESDFTSMGNVNINLLISTNNNKFLPITSVASGGERARVILALKKIIVENSDVSTIIFDEVDTGVSGRVAKAMGLIMQEIALKTQVIAITHLPQVASIAKYCLSVEKTNEDKEVVSNIKYVDGEEKVLVIAKLLSGEIVTEEAINNAKSLLEKG